MKRQHTIEHPTCQQSGCSQPATHYQRHFGDTTMCQTVALYLCDDHSARDICQHRNKLVIWDDIFYPSIELVDGMITSRKIGSLTLYAARMS